MVELGYYQHCLQKEYNKYYRIFVEQNGSDSTEKLINIDEEKVLVRKVERLLRCCNMFEKNHGQKRMKQRGQI